MNLVYPKYPLEDEIYCTGKFGGTLYVMVKINDKYEVWNSESGKYLGVHNSLPCFTDIKLKISIPLIGL